MSLTLVCIAGWKSSHGRALENAEIVAGTGDKNAMSRLTLGKSDASPCQVLSSPTRVPANARPNDPVVAESVIGSMRQLPMGVCTLVNWDFK
jgi:hypothetical protein